MSDVELDKIYHGDARDVLRTLPDGMVHTCVTSPPYWGLRNYGVEGQLGLEATPEEYVGRLVEVFREVRRVLRDDGTLWVVLGDSYTSGMRSRYDDDRRKYKTARAHDMRPPTPKGLKPKELCLIPSRVSMAIQSDGWWLRAKIIWHKINANTESVKDRCWTTHEYIFHFSKSANYYFNFKGLGKRFRRSVWSTNTSRYPEAHFATFPPELIQPCVRSGSPKGGVVLDPFFGRGTTGRVALEYGRHFVGVELNEDYVKMAERYLAPFRQQSILL